MNKPVWYIQNRSDRDISTQNLIYTIQEMGMEVYCEKYVPFGEMDYSFLPTDRPVIAHGSISGIKDIMKRGKNGEHFYPCAWCDFTKLTCRSYYTHWGKYLLQEIYAFYTLSEILRLKDFIFDIFGIKGKVFIRPDENNKEFTGEVVCLSKFDLWRELVLWNDPPMDLLCVVAKPKDIEAEYRLIMSEGKVVTGSGYREDKIIKYNSNYPDNIIAFAEEVTETWSPHPIFCLDIAITADGCKVVECGSVNCAGYYSSDLHKIVEAASDVASKEWNSLFTNL